MPDCFSLLFVGGVADSGKSVLLNQVAGYAKDIKVFAVSDFLRNALEADHRNPSTKLGPEVTFIDWKSYETKAVDGLVEQIGECFQNEPHLKTIAINSHFATYSPGGFMAGLDATSIDRICNACHLTSTATGKAAVVLVDIGLADVLHWRGQNWTSNIDAFGAGSALMQDLEFNRLYALHYYNILRTTLMNDCVLYQRVFLDYSKLTHFSDNLASESEFKIKLKSFTEFLKTELFTAHAWRP